MQSDWASLKWGVSIAASGSRALLLMISYCCFWLRISLCNIYSNCWAFYLIYIIFKLRSCSACFWSCFLKLLLFFWELRPPCFFTLPLLPPLFLEVFLLFVSITPVRGTPRFCTVGVGNLQRGFPALLFRLKSLQSSIATWI